MSSSSSLLCEHDRSLLLLGEGVRDRDRDLLILRESREQETLLRLSGDSERESLLAGEV